MKSSAKILIIIVTWNKKEYVINLLDSLSAINFPRDQFDILSLIMPVMTAQLKHLKPSLMTFKLFAMPKISAAQAGLIPA